MSTINDNNEEIKLYQQTIDKLRNRMQKNLLQGNAVSQKQAKTQIDQFIKNANLCFDQSIPDDNENKLKAQTNVTNALKSYPCLKELINPLEQINGLKYENEILAEEEKAQKLQEKAKSKQQKNKSSQKVEAPDVEQEGHLYPVKLVSDWTAKLKQYNQQMDDFIADLDSLSPQVDLTWVCKKIETFCNKINYALAKLRYQIIKGLSGVFKQAQQFTKLLDPIVNFNLAALPSVLGWASNVVSFFFKPYMTVIKFINDFMTYTPPLVSEAASLVGKTASIPVHLLGIIDRVSLVADDKNGDKKEFAEVIKSYVNIQVEPITLGDVMGGGTAKPKKPQVKSVAAAKELAKQKASNALQETENIFEEFKNYILGCPSPAYGEVIYTAYPFKMDAFNQTDLWVALKKGSTTVHPNYDKSFITVSEAAEMVCGKNWSSKKNIKINTRRYEMYPVRNSMELVNKFKEDPREPYLFIWSYYTYTYSNSTKKADVSKLETASSYINFLKAFTPNFPRIPEFLDKMGNAFLNYQQLDKKFQEMK